ncbi:hypothetical protein GRF59_10375 [Paenibacillus sp. HJL G12]|uniref:FtsK domain-containing protein n=1 Tax=Paenibacillus dendrobii TaxID=2691084 RepID=A0A7X3IHH5_9BACL|nr:FtsK/SpoIIIE domain-containing protein [Paenibacillus dendrobii]MWV44039.1 hypothetical protein [Paenibacillus dendrobii]
MNNINQNDKARRERNRLRKAAYLHFITGIRQLITIHKWKNVFVAAYMLVASCAWVYRGKLLFGLDSAFSLFPVLKIAFDWLVVLLLLLGLLCLISVIGTPLKAKLYQDRLISSGFTNHSHEPPLLLAKYKHPKNPKLTIWEFDENETSLSTWENKKDNIKGALIDTILHVKQSRNGRRVILTTVSPRSMLPPILRWQDNYLSKESFELILGESLIGRETVNLAKIPHILLGGSSGSGKSLLLKLLLMQAMKKGAEVYIADFKGGVDFSRVWHQKCRICFDENDLLDLLTSLTNELQRRKAALREEECVNNDEYNAATYSHLKRIIFACDEIAEILDKTGFSKERKELISQIESHLSVIARQGRAFGMHLIIATQRPSADILSGQIRSNIDCRICGRADNILSQIILDSTEAAEQIPKDAQGRFITNTGLIFQSYLFDDNEVFSSGSRAIGG